MTKTRNGFFLIADITGYTQYLHESELEHAQETLTALLGLLVDNTFPPLVISRLAGDAVISYGLEENFFKGQAFIEMLENTYVAFRKIINLMVLNNTCRCRACANIGNLDLKFFVHYGTFGIQRIANHDELVGSDVNLIHRLLKNSVSEATGFSAYALYTDASIQQLKAEDFQELLVPHHETYEHLGDVNVWIQVMHPGWENKRVDSLIDFPTDGGQMEFEVAIEIPRAQVWDYFIQPEFRNFMLGSDRMKIANRSQGRITEGSIYECYHGDTMAQHLILEWIPFERMIVQEGIPLFKKNKVMSECRLESIENGTKVTRTYAPVTGPVLGRLFGRFMMLLIGGIMKKSVVNFKNTIESDYKAHQEPPVYDAKITAEQIREAVAEELQSSSKS
jgi:hypothetical protein